MTTPVLPVRVVTLSASFGAGGSFVGPRLADRLGWQFLDRAIPFEVAERLAVPLAEALARDDQDEDAHLLRRLLNSFRHVDPIGAPAPPASMDAERDDFVAATEAVLRQAADRGEVVMLGRAAAVVLAAHPHALHVRLHGPADQRVAQAAGGTGRSLEDSRRLLEQTDRAREGYVRRIYHRDPDDPRLYHVRIDSTRVALPACVEALATLVQPA